jgi:Mrp family chromosome partitioning ATPase
MKEFIDKLKGEFDVVIIDSPPVMTITDAEVLSHIVDMSILVVFAEKTEIDWLIEATNQLTSHGQKSFIGTVLNNFDYNSGYRSYNKYNHSKYYSRVDETKQKEWVQS